MSIEVKMAKLSPTMESGQLVKWLVKVGDKVKEGDTLAEVQTDKAVMPMESFDEGTVAWLDVREGDDLALGQRLLVLAEKGEDQRSVAAEAKSSSGATATQPQTAPAPAAQELADEAEAEDLSASSDGGRIKATPLAKKIAAEAGLDLALVPGSGPAGRIIREDVEKFIRGELPARTAPASPAGPATAPARPRAPAAFTPVPPSTAKTAQRIPHTHMRRTIADRMFQAKQAAPEIHLTVDIPMDQTVDAREHLNTHLAKENIKLSLGDFVTKAVAMSLRRHPDLNASWSDEAIIRHAEVNIGIAVALEGGLMVPVLHNADQLGLRDIRQKTVAFADAARTGKLQPAQLMGGTFTISNLGMFGTRQFDAILNLPEVGILAIGATEQRPVVREGQLAAGWVMSVTLTADHRAVDGATAAEFLRTLSLHLEHPASMLL